MKIEGSFGLTISLLSMLSNLTDIGVRSFYDSLESFCNEVKQKANPSKMRMDVVKSNTVIKLLQDIMIIIKSLKT
jgi:hypothetical protein